MLRFLLWLLLLILCLNLTLSSFCKMHSTKYKDKYFAKHKKYSNGTIRTKVYSQKYLKPDIQPNIIFILADDMGWNDISFHGSSEFITPNIDALAYNGIQLHRLYALPICTPSRSALMTGYHPINIGMQHRVLYGLEPRGLPLNLTLLPQYLNDLGYESHIAGKWHLGFWKKEYTPLYRGFKSHVGLWSGHHHYFDHWAREWGVGGLDMRINMEPAPELKGEYTTDIISRRAVHIIENHDKEKPLFLYISHAACHSADRSDPLPVKLTVEQKFVSIKDKNRRKFAATTWKMDDSIGKVVKALKEREMLGNSIIVFSSDNGGAAGGMNHNSASNWPLKGVKNTLWEGGVRVAALIWSPYLKSQQRVSRQYMHFSDWLPTLYHAAGGNLRNLNNIDGMNLWPALSNNLPSPRNEILHNIDDVFKNAAITIGQWKLIIGLAENGKFDKWIGPHGRSDKYNYQEVYNSMAAKALRSIGFDVSIDKMKQLREEADIIQPKTDKLANPCNLRKQRCLFNIIDDPCETDNLADKYPNIVTQLVNRLKELKQTASQPSNKQLIHVAHPKFFKWVWTNYGDYVNVPNLF